MGQVQSGTGADIGTHTPPLIEEIESENNPNQISRERGIKHGVVNVKVSSLVPSRGQTERIASYTVYPRGAIFHGAGGNPEGVVEAIGKQSNYICSLPEKILLQDARVHDLLVMYTQGWHVFPSPEVFSRHSGTCLVVGDRMYQHPAVPIKLGDCFRLGSVGIVVSEIKTADGIEQRLDSKALQYLRDEAVAFDIAEEEACLAADEGGFDDSEKPGDYNHSNPDFGNSPTITSPGLSKKTKKMRKLYSENATIDGMEDGDEYEGNDTDQENDEEEKLMSNCTLNGVTIGEHAKKDHGVSRYFCYMCYECHDTATDPLVAPCLCRGDTRYLHVQCLQKWYQSTGNGTHAQVIRTTGNGAPACKICGAAYKTVFRNADGKKVSLLEMNSSGPYITLIVVTKHDTNPSLFNTRFRLNFSNEFPLSQNSLNLDDRIPGMNGPPVSISIGRSSTCNMVVDYRTVSTRHAKIYFENGQFFLQDHRSSNGTMLYLREPLALPYDRVVKLRVGRSTLSIEANPRWATLNSLFSRSSSLTSRTTNPAGTSLMSSMFGCMSCSSAAAVDNTAHAPTVLGGTGLATTATGGIVTTDAAGNPEEDDDSTIGQPGIVGTILKSINMASPPNVKLPPLPKLSPVEIYNTLIEVSKRPPIIANGKMLGLEEEDSPGGRRRRRDDQGNGSADEGGMEDIGPSPSGNSPRRVNSTRNDGLQPSPRRTNSGRLLASGIDASPERERHIRESSRYRGLASSTSRVQEVLLEEAQIQRLLLEAIAAAGNNEALTPRAAIPASSSIIAVSSSWDTNSNVLETAVAPNNNSDAALDYEDITRSAEVNNTIQPRNMGMRGVSPRENIPATHAIGAAIANGLARKPSFKKRRNPNAPISPRSPRVSDKAEEESPPRIALTDAEEQNDIAAAIAASLADAQPQPNLSCSSEGVYVRSSGSEDACLGIGSSVTMDQIGDCASGEMQTPVMAPSTSGVFLPILEAAIPVPVPVSVPVQTIASQSDVTVVLPVPVPVATDDAIAAATVE